MKGFKKIITLSFLAVIAVALVGCKEDKKGETAETNDTLVVAYSEFSEKFSPFFADTAYDVDVYGMTQVSLLASDRGGNIIKDGIEGETVSYNGTDYTYYGLGDLDITQNNDGSVYYDITIRDDVKFSDGTALTIDDVIFTMYVYSDTDYDGSTTFYSLPIKGMQEYRLGLSTSALNEYSDKVEVVLDAWTQNKGYTDLEAASKEKVTEAEFNELTAILNADPITNKTAIKNGTEKNIWVELANDIVSYCTTNYAGYCADDPIINGMILWGFMDNKYDLVKSADGLYSEDGDTLYTVTTDSSEAEKTIGDVMYKEATETTVNSALYTISKTGNTESATKYTEDRYTYEIHYDYTESTTGVYGKVGNEYVELYTLTTDKSEAVVQTIANDGTKAFYKKATTETAAADLVYIANVVANKKVKVVTVQNYTGNRYTTIEVYTDGVKDYTFDENSCPDIYDYAKAIKKAYKNNFANAAGTEAADLSYDSYISAVTNDWMKKAAAAAGKSEAVNNISGIVKGGENDDYDLRIITTEFSATTIYQLALPVAPLHYYGSTAKYDYANNKFGFDKGDLSAIRSKTTTPMGAGPYKFIEYKDGIVTFERNESYYLGTPNIKYIKFKEYSTDSDKTPALVNGDIDIATPTLNNSVLAVIKEANSNNELKGNTVTTELVQYNGYGYLGISADRLYVGTKETKGSDASKNLRKAFATIFAAYREYTVNSYYGDRASVINYPISSCSWAAPQVTDTGYNVAYSKDVDGNSIYSADMTEQQKFDAALQAAIGFFKEAGYTWSDSTQMFTAAPEGAKLSYTIWIPGDGTGDHPTFNMVVAAQEALADIGIELVIKDLTNSSALWTGLDAGEVDMWCAAWGGSSDPDMYQVYHSSNATGSNHYHIADATLDAKIMQARQSADNAVRKTIYKEALEIVLDWGVEVPVYQRNDCTVFSTERIDITSLTKDMTPYWSYLSEIEKVKLK